LTKNVYNSLHIPSFCVYNSTKFGKKS
jgi:hypothetical protein